MRICIDVTPLLLRSAGVKTYFHNWLRHLRDLRGQHEILAFPRLDSAGPLDHRGSQLGSFATAWRIALLLSSNYGAPGTLRMLLPRADVFHVSNQVRRPPSHLPLTATVHDMTCWLMPELHTEGNIRADTSFGDRVLRRARGLIAVSGNTRNDTARVLGIAPDRIHVIYPGVGDAYFAAVPGDAAKRLGLTSPYLIFVGTIEPRKNVGVLLDAWSQLPGELRDRHMLAVVGPAGWNAEATVARLQQPSSGVRYLGYVSEADLPSLVAGAQALVYPSLYEGFGFPVAQAMACGIPVITSNVSSLPEVAGEAAVLVDPRSAAEIRAAMERVLTNPEQRSQLGEAGRRIACERYRWAENARQSLEFFEKVLSS